LKGRDKEVNGDQSDLLRMVTSCSSAPILTLMTRGGKSFLKSGTGTQVHKRTEPNGCLKNKTKRKENTAPTGVSQFAWMKGEVYVWCKCQANPYHQTRNFLTKVVSGGQEGSGKSLLLLPSTLLNTGLGQANLRVAECDDYGWSPSLRSGWYVRSLCGITVQGRVSI